MDQRNPKDGAKPRKKKLTEKELRRLAHERVWGSAEPGQFQKLESVLPDTAKPKAPEVDIGEPDQKGR